MSFLQATVLKNKVTHIPKHVKFAREHHSFGRALEDQRAAPGPLWADTNERGPVGRSGVHALSLLTCMRATHVFRVP
jgi:hypothetical protein